MGDASIRYHDIQVSKVLHRSLDQFLDFSKLRDICNVAIGFASQCLNFFHDLRETRVSLFSNSGESSCNLVDASLVRGNVVDAHIEAILGESQSY